MLPQLKISAKCHKICNCHNFYLLANFVEGRVFANRIAQFAIEVKNMPQIVFAATT